MAFGLKNKDERIKVHINGYLFDFIGDYCESIKLTNKRIKVNEVDEFPNGDVCLVFFTNGKTKLITTIVLKAYRLKKLIDNLNE